MSKEVFGELSLSHAISDLKAVREKGIIFLLDLPCDDFMIYNEEYRKAVDTVLNFVDCAVSAFSSRVEENNKDETDKM